MIMGTLSMSSSSSPAQYNNLISSTSKYYTPNSIFPSFSIESRTSRGLSIKKEIIIIPRTRSRRRNSYFGCLGVLSSKSAASSSSKMSESSSLEFDVVVVGAGIIGLTIARQFLMGTDDLSVAVVDAAVPGCPGATGAGQGYLWMGHKTPESDKWELALRSKRLWDMFAESIQHQGLDPLDVLGWKKTGSLLIGSTQEEVATLKQKVKLLCEAGLRAEYLSASDLLLKEPSLEIEKEGGAAFLADDCQLDARRAVAFIEKGNRHFVSKGRYAEFYNDPALRLLRSDKSGEVEAVQTSKNTLYCKKAVVVAAGSWSGSLMRDLVRESNIKLDVPVTPRKGHLLVIENFKEMQLNHGMMEVGYVGHQTAASHCTPSVSSVIDQGQTLSISMTATTDAMGNLVLGSSREFAGYNMEVDDSIIERIWVRAGDFFPSLRKMSLTDLTKSRKVRVGLRPYMVDGKPIIGPVPDLPKVVLATGHEGEGLLLALGTAEMVVDMVLGNTGKVDYAPFSVQGRC